MSAVNKDALISACADAYRTASETTGQVRAGEIAEKISALYKGKPKGILFCETDGSGNPLKIELFGISGVSKYQFSAPLYKNVTAVELTDSPITILLDYSFSGCSGLQNIDDVISQAIVLSNGCFLNCTGLTEVTFTTTPVSISSSAFTGCTGINMIRVPWSEGHIGGAPWGAENATMVYDYSGGAAK